jgi:hypothetical protein
MKDFFQIVPSVIAHMMECRLLLKDKLLRRGHEDKRYTHTYDGFLLGVAFVLKVTLFRCSFHFLPVYFTGTSMNMFLLSVLPCW